MSEKEPQLPHFSLDIGTEILICTPDNTFAYLYEDNRYDYIFYMTRQEEDRMMGYRIFRHLMPEQFDRVVMKMINDGYVVSNEEEISEDDLCAYKKSLPDYYELPDPESGWGNTKREKARKWGKFVAYLAEQIANGKDESTF